MPTDNQYNELTTSQKQRRHNRDILSDVILGTLIVCAVCAIIAVGGGCGRALIL
jgi:hypothetical protein